jgi:DNA-binding MarR family transcriptional regulator
MVQVFDFKDYKTYLAKALVAAQAEKKGAKSRLAEALKVHPSVVTSVLSKKAHFSPEHAEAASRFFAHGEDEAHYFFLLVSLARAGTPGLRKMLEKQIDERRRDYINLKKKFQAKETLSEADLAIFYSSYQYSAVLNALTVPGLRARDVMAKQLQIEPRRLAEVLKFLEQSGLVRFDKGEPVEVRNWLHVSDNRALIARDHNNWRLYSIRAFERNDPNNLHYSSVITLSENDVFRVKKLFLQALEDARAIIKPSKEEKLCSLLLDFFEV